MILDWDHNAELCAKYTSHTQKELKDYLHLSLSNSHPDVVLVYPISLPNEHYSSHPFLYPLNFHTY